MRLSHLVAFGAPAAGLALLVAVGSSASAPPVDEAARVRCATRLSVSITGQAPDAALLTNADPQSQVDTLLASPAFIEQFSRFINSNMNPEPGETPAEDAAYYLSRYLLENNRPWHELFDGAYDIVPVPAANGQPATANVVAKADGMGYFRSRPWMVRYAGNEEDGYRLNAAYRIQQNITGLDVSAVTTAPGMDISAAGRQSAACAGCHYDPWFALDKVAKILSRRTGDAMNPTFVAPNEGPQTLLDGRQIANDKELVDALVASTDFKFRTCRLAFEFLYGRKEANCEAALFDKCIDAFTQSGDVRAALRTIAQDQSYCE